MADFEPEKKETTPNFEYPHPRSIDELGKHLDPTLLKNIVKIHVDTIKYVRVTVAFWDISGFSDLSNRLKDVPNDIVYFLKMYCDNAIEIIRKYNGILDKFMGDGILAYFGYDGIREIGSGDPMNAINASIEFKTKFREIKQKFLEYCKENNGLTKYASAIDLKCGINQGPAFLHYFSNSKRNSIIIFGPTVNLASRLEGFARSDEIIISDVLKEIVGPKIDYEEIPITSRLPEGIQSFPDEKFVYKILCLKSSKNENETIASTTDNVFMGNSIVWNPPLEIRFETPAKVYARFSGSVKFGSLTLRIRDSEDMEYWFPDYGSYNSDIDTGNQTFELGQYSNTWNFTLTKEYQLKPGVCYAKVEMYENTETKGEKRLIASSDERKITYIK